MRLELFVLIILDRLCKRRVDELPPIGVRSLSLILAFAHEVFLARLKLVRALTVYYSLNFLKKDAVGLFDLICSVFFELHGFCIRNCN